MMEPLFLRKIRTSGVVKERWLGVKLTGSEYEAIVEASPNMIWRAGLDANCNYFNETWLKFTGKPLEEEVGAGWLEGVHPEDMDACMNTYLSSFRKQEPFEMEYRLKRHDGLWRWINDRGVPVYDANHTFLGYIGSCVDVTERVEGRKLIALAHYDKLTGVYNRNYLEVLIDYECQRSRREHSTAVYILIDVDHFKYFNDQYGHDFGDKVLFCVASTITKKLRDSDYLGRYGGDEFLILLPQTSLADAALIAERILAEISLQNLENSNEPISLSMGIAEQNPKSGPKNALKNADEAMFRAKKNGGNQFAFG
ncbi:MAG: sensor domain-containing diguanylate cyclase [Christensenella sp.]